MAYTKKKVIAMQANSAAIDEHVHRLMLVGKHVAFHGQEQLHNLRLREKHAV